MAKAASVLFSLLIMALAWWGSRIQTSVDTLTKAVTELQVRAEYTNGKLPAAPIVTKLEAP